MSAPQLQIDAVLAQLDSVILGKQQQLRLCLACLLAHGHLLIEDVPGVGKTMLAHALAKTLGLSMQRIQFTSDLLPSDVLGVSIYDRRSGEFRFQHGPIFSQLVLADEINRASPKSQSALLEAMEEHQVTLDGKSMALPDPFFVIATQNPLDQAGTFPLPESQLDRFLMRVHLGYPAAAAERELLNGTDRREMVGQLGAILDLIAQGTISGKIAKDVFDIAWNEGGDPHAIVEARGMKQVSDVSALEAIVDDIIARNPDKVDDAKTNPKAIGWFVGQVMKASGGKANPQTVNELLKTRIGG